MLTRTYQHFFTQFWTKQNSLYMKTAPQIACKRRRLSIKRLACFEPWLKMIIGTLSNRRRRPDDNLVPRALVTLVQRNGKTKTSGKMRLNSAFHWPLTERAQFIRKLINNNFVPRFPILSRAGRMGKLWVRSLRART